MDKANNQELLKFILDSIEMIKKDLAVSLVVMISCIVMMV